jgi:hypothetical protein
MKIQSVRSKNFRTLKDVTIAYRTATLEAAREAPEMYMQILAKAEGK